MTNMSDIYIYKYFFNGNQKVLGAWMKFTVKGVVRGIEFLNSDLHLLTVHNGSVMLEKINLSESHLDVEGYVTNLDRRIRHIVDAGETLINLPYTPRPNDVIKVYDTKGNEVSATRSDDVVTLTTAPTADTPYYLGYPYTMKYTFSEQIFKAQSGQAKTPSSASKLLTRNGAIYYNNTAEFKVKVTPSRRTTSENILEPTYDDNGNVVLEDGFFRFPVFSNPEDTIIEIESDSALPINLTSAEFESFLHSRSNRYN